MVDRVWRTFKMKFEMIQQEKADLACAELLENEAMEKAKVNEWSSVTKGNEQIPWRKKFFHCNLSCAVLLVMISLNLNTTFYYIKAILLVVACRINEFQNQNLPIFKSVNLTKLRSDWTSQVEKKEKKKTKKQKKRTSEGKYPYYFVMYLRFLSYGG